MDWYLSRLRHVKPEIITGVYFVDKQMLRTGRAKRRIKLTSDGEGKSQRRSCARLMKVSWRKGWMDSLLETRIDWQQQSTNGEGVEWWVDEWGMIRVCGQRDWATRNQGTRKAGEGARCHSTFRESTQKAKCQILNTKHQLFNNQSLINFTTVSFF